MVSKAQKKAQQTYNKTTKTVSFRVKNKLYDELEALKSETGASYSDFVKIGANKCEAEVKAKLSRINALRQEIGRLNTIIEEKKAEAEASQQEWQDRRKAELEREYRAEETALENRQEELRTQLYQLMEQVDSKQSELTDLETEIGTAKKTRQQVLDELVVYQKKHSEHQMTGFMISIVMMGMFSNILQSLSQGSLIPQQKISGPQPQQPAPALQWQPGETNPSPTNTVESLLSAMPVFMMMSMMTSIMSPPKKKPSPPEAETRPSALADLIRKSREAKAEASKRKLEIAEPQEVPEEEEEEPDETSA